MAQQRQTSDGQRKESLGALLERARRVLLHEQRTGHADAAVKPGGLTSFITYWSKEMEEARASSSTAAGDSTLSGDQVEQTLTKLLLGYQTQDPMRRAANVRSALALLDRATAPAGTPVTTPLPKAGSGRKIAGDKSPWSRHDASAATPPKSVPRSAGTHATLVELPGRPEGNYLLQSPVTSIPGVGATQAERLRRLDVESIADLLFTYPREHLDYSTLEKIANLPFGEVCTVLGLIWEVDNQRTSGGRTRTIARINDETGSIRATWFNQPYLKKQLTPGDYIVITGIKQRFGNRVEFNVRSHELPEKGDLINTGRLVPVYRLTEGLSPKVLRRYTKWAVDHCARLVPEHLPTELRSRARLMVLPQAVAEMHYPESPDSLRAARRRLAFDELFLIQLGMLTRRAHRLDGPQAPVLSAPESLIFLDGQPDLPSHAPSSLGPVAMGDGLWPLTAQCLEKTLPFRLTQAQRLAIREIIADLHKPQPMSRLLQGDVGSGKTVVAAAALLVAAANGYQGALLAPTEILAEQHYRSLASLLSPFGLHVVLLTGRQRAKDRSAARDALTSGQAAVAVGTHALIQEDVTFSRLALAIVDEQHRFGVEQRDSLRAKGYNPHMLVMTATPIPRTLALTLYGDLDISVLDELPPGRQPIITRWRTGTQVQEAYRMVVDQVATGRQAYIICPLVEESEALEAKSAIAEYERLKREVFPDLRLGLVHGQLRPAEKDAVMRSFRDGMIDVLVATAVVEVGVDVPNASIMMVEDADRFGLSQLHQFRGRVGRGQYQSYCYLLSHEAGAASSERLKLLENTSDGFQLAEEDLRLRGAGDFFGTRQSGLPELKVANLADSRLLSEARELAEWLWQQDPYLKALEHAALRERVFLFWRKFMAH
ncbi:MAG: DNA helicase RecG [Chloroflexi bacterium]|nr:MAG: DNA helicase RecG [Chloroflexota bacterium]